MKDLTPYRQPMVTSLGIIMGFLLNFLAGWAVRDDPSAELRGTADFLVMSTLLPSLLLMVYVLFRLLDPRHDPERLESVYLNILRLYMSAIALAFCGVFVAIFF